MKTDAAFAMEFRAVTEICPASRLYRLCTNAKQSNWCEFYEGFDFILVLIISQLESEGFEEFTRKAIWLHEYFHEYLQRIQRLILKNLTSGFTPTLVFSEGSAVFLENGAQNYKSFESYLEMRKIRSINQSLDEAWFLDFGLLSMSLREELGQLLYAMKYEMSAMTIEFLVALKGPDSLVRLIEHMAMSLQRRCISALNQL